MKNRILHLLLKPNDSIKILFNLTEPILPGILSHGPPDEVAIIMVALPNSSLLYIIIDPIVSVVSFFFFLSLHFLIFFSLIKFILCIPLEIAYFWAPDPTKILKLSNYNVIHWWMLELLVYLVLIFNQFLANFKWILNTCESRDNPQSGSGRTNDSKGSIHFKFTLRIQIWT